MKIIILGAGQVGSGLAEFLKNENNEITIIDHDIDKLEAMQNRLDVQIVKGNGTYPAILRDAGAANAELFVAVTDSDEINMLACQLAYALYHIPQKIARIRNNDYLAEQHVLFNQQAITIDNIIAPEQLLVEEITRLIEYPGAVQMADFAYGRLAVVCVKAYYGGPLVGYPISQLRHHLPNAVAKIVAVYRQGRLITTNNNTVIDAGDEVYFIATRGHIRSVMGELQKLETPYRRIMIVGGNNIGSSLALNLATRYSIKLIEPKQQKAVELANYFDKTNVEVYFADPSNQDFLIEEHIDKMDLIVCVTENDETNIMCSMLAKKLGARKSILLISKFAYVNLIQGANIDIVLSPQEATISALLTAIRHNGVEAEHTFRRGATEALEIMLQGTKQQSSVVGRKISEITLPIGVTICAIYRDDEVFIATDDKVLQTNDLVIFFVTELNSMRELIKLTTPKSNYFLNLGKKSK